MNARKQQELDFFSLYTKSEIKKTIEHMQKGIKPVYVSSCCHSGYTEAFETHHASRPDADVWPQCLECGHYCDLIEEE